MDLRTIKTRQLIKDTFREMVNQMEISRITVTALCGKARINRKTFYFHYETIEALVREILDEITDDYISYTDRLPRDRPHEDANRLFFTYFSQREDYVQKIICSPSCEELCNVIFDKAYQHALERSGRHYLSFSQEKQNIVHVFYRSSTLDIYRQWTKDGRTMSLDEVVELSNRLICHGVADL